MKSREKPALKNRGRNAMRIHRFKGHEVTVSVTGGENPKIIIYNTLDGHILTKGHLDKSLVGFQIEKGEVPIDDSFENSGILDFLIVNGYVREPHRWEKSGVKLIPIVKLQN